MRELIEAAKAVCDQYDYTGTVEECEAVNRLIEAVERAELENQTENELFTYTKGYEDGKQYVTHRVKRVLDGKPVPASIDCGLFEVKDKSTVTNLNLADGVYRLTVTNLNLADGVYRLLAIREEI